ncbi:hypothetical protein PVAP13_5KG013524 [Panicum virgatum]|uniref:Secreted protein n=1 Tax=Panicum virgatum TaxID=38727 RepID=A0A8T0S8M2_PANVG|nr:hypothetical protein PVAP13_5KG013524 [Panicum virgatum]
MKGLFGCIALLYSDCSALAWSWSGAQLRRHYSTSSISLCFFSFNFLPPAAADDDLNRQTGAGIDIN